MNFLYSHIICVHTSPVSLASHDGRYRGYPAFIHTHINHPHHPLIPSNTYTLPPFSTCDETYQFTYL